MLVGVRTWRIAKFALYYGEACLLKPGHVLLGVFQAQPWRIGEWNRSECCFCPRQRGAMRCDAFPIDVQRDEIGGHKWGFYAFNSLDRLLAYNDELRLYHRAEEWGLVSGEAALAGRVVVADYGYRAEQAAVVGLFGPEPGWIWALRFRWDEGERAFIPEWRSEPMNDERVRVLVIPYPPSAREKAKFQEEVAIWESERSVA
jgi:hypothetical protein